MASIHASSEKQTNADVPLELLVFSCGTCQATIPEVYATTESNKGFHSGSGDDEGIVTKMWIAECSHMICGKHLPGGAAPFHADGQQPRAPCPQCSETGDLTPRALYGIRGLQPGQLDPQIPTDWVQCPATEFDGAVPGMEAVRFQYMSIARYAQRATYHWKRAQLQHQSMESAYTHEHEDRLHLIQELGTLKARLVALEAMEVKLLKWEARQPIINHYLNVVSEMANDMGDLRQHLKRLGYDVPEKSYAFNGSMQTDGTETCLVAATIAKPPPLEFNSSSTTAVAELDNSSSSHKRKPMETEHERRTRPAPFDRAAQANSRDMMPPPLMNRVVPQSSHTTCISAQHRHDQMQVEMPFRPTKAHRENAVTGQVADDMRQDHNAQSFQWTHRVESQEHNQYGRMAGDMHKARPSGSRSAQRQLWPSTLNEQQGSQRLLAKQSTGQHARPLITTYEADHGALAQQHHFQERSVARPPDSARQVPGWMKSGGHRNTVRMTPSPPRPAPAPSKSVISPFFKQYAFGQANPRNAPANDRGVSPSRASLCTGAKGLYNVAEHDITSQSNGQPPQSVFNAVGHQHRFTSAQPYQSQTQLRTASRNSEWRGGTIPQTPRNSQGLFQRLDRMHSPGQAFVPPRSQSSAHRGRVSFPPGPNRNSPARLYQDDALSKIRGVRGASSQSFRPGPFNRGPLYDPPAPPFSSAGGRRTVRR